MSKKPNKKNAILEYVKNNPTAKNAEVAKACGVHPTYSSFIRRNDGVKKPKKSKPAATPEFVFKQDDFAFAMRQINALKREIEEWKDENTRLCGVIEYLEIKLENATSI